MASNINLQDIPQLVLEKIMSFLNHKELLTLEQVSKKLNSAVDSHFYITDHIILGSLPAIGRKEELPVTTNYRKSFDSLNKIIDRCGTRLTTIQINDTDQFCAKFL